MFFVTTHFVDFKSSLLIFFWSPMIDSLRNTSQTVINLQKNNMINERNRAIAQTTQMLAHDVRRPFSMIKALMSMLNDAHELESQAIAKNSLPDIEIAINSVEGMIQDVMEVGSETSLHRESVNCGYFIHKNLKDVFQYRKDADIEISVKIDRHLLLDIDSLKFSRVVQNIVSNAIEHMKGRGAIWINTTYGPEGIVKIVIGNSGTYIEPQDRKNLFNAFFTKGKKGGTGLGLAIAKKIVEAHGGEIYCESSIEIGTEFSLTVPGSISELTDNEIHQPNHSNELLRESSTVEQITYKQNDVDQSLLENVRNQSLTTVLLDDEQIYIDSIRSLFTSLKIDNKLLSYLSGRRLLNEFESSADLVILDVDIGDHHSDGFDICRNLRSQGFAGKICIHSNRGRLEYQPKAIEAGADFFIPKPMNRGDLLLLLQQCTAVQTKVAPKVKVILFEDESIYQRQWRRIFASDHLLIFESLSLFDLKLLDDCDYIITDYYLKNDDTGASVARYLKQSGYSGKIFLSSNIEGLDDESKNLFDLIVSKDANDAIAQIADFFRLRPIH